MIGQRFGRLVVIGEAPRFNGHKMLVCQCDCGSIKTAYQSKMIKGHTRSCGCFSIDSRRERMTTHGKTGTRAYIIWKHIRQRCHNPKDAAFKDYGGRGITVCDRWRESFENFLADMGECPLGLEIDRIKNDKGYEPGNCKWSTKTENCRNRRSNRLITHNGETRLSVEWAELSGTKRQTIEGRLNNGWEAGKAIFQSPRKRG